MDFKSFENRNFEDKVESNFFTLKRPKRLKKLIIMTLSIFGDKILEFSIFNKALLICQITVRTAGQASRISIPHKSEKL